MVGVGTAVVAVGVLLVATEPGRRDNRALRKARYRHPAYPVPRRTEYRNLRLVPPPYDYEREDEGGDAA